MDTLRRSGHCSTDRCENASVARLAEQALCLHHFLIRCYDELDRIDPRARKELREDEQERAREFIEQCSNQTLHVCLLSEGLSNLEKGRLLDILLWASEIYELARPSLRSPFGKAPCQVGARGVRLVFAKR